MASLSSSELRELTETASVFEMIAQTDPGDLSALEALREIYARVGDESKLAAISDRLAAARGEPSTPAAPAAPAPVPGAPVPLVPSRPPGRLRPLGEVLVAEGLITRDQLGEALRAQQGSNQKLGSVLVRLNFLSADQLAAFLSRQYGIPSATLAGVTIDPQVLRLVPSELAWRYDVVPVSREGDTLTLAMADPLNLHAIDHLGFLTGLHITPVVAGQSAIRESIERAYEGQQTVAAADALAAIAGDLGDLEVVDDVEVGASLDVLELKESADEAPVVRLVNRVLVDAIHRGASDIHFETYEKVFRIRCRIDGVLHDTLTVPKRLEPAVVSRIKIMSSLDIAERRLPQDGRMKLRYSGREIDFRVSTLPTIFGEKTVLRILDRAALKLDLKHLGFDEWSLEQFQRAIHQPYGMVLITGPTGSGKTTTLYSAINTINSPDVNIMTAEDPVEYNLKGVNQVQINDGIGRTFAAALRSFLRQDPDVILVGETRDLETAQIAIRAALTGHLVFSTLHTNDSPSTVARLVDMGVPPFLVGSSLLLVAAQRLGRRVCVACREGYEADEDVLVPYGHVPTGVGRTVLYRGKGCQACNFTGMKGRVAVYEAMPITPEVRDLVIHNAPTPELRAMAQRQGMKTLRQAGLLKVLEGLTTVEEILRVTIAE